MGCVDIILDPIGGSIAPALGMYTPVDYTGTAFAFDSTAWGNGLGPLGKMGSMLASDWVAFKHLLVPDMRKDREVQAQSAINSRTIVYGRTRVGNQLAFAESTGDSNQTFHMLCVFAGHEIDGYEEIYFDDKLVATSAGGWVINDPFTGKVVIELFDGTQTTASASMVAASAGVWTNDHKLLGVAYAHVTLTYDEGTFPSGMPTVKAVLRGKKVLDTRTGLLAWSCNPAMCIRDYMLTPVRFGGMGCDTDEINEASFVTAADTCDEIVYSNMPPGQAPGTKTTIMPIPGETPLYPEPRYTLNGILKLDGVPTNFISSMLSSCAGEAVYSAGEWKIYAGSPASSVGTIDESWLNGGISFQINSNKNNKVNFAKGKFTNSNDYWADSEFPPVPIGASTPPNTTYWIASSPTSLYDTDLTYAQNSYVLYVGKIYKAYSTTTVPVDTPPPNSTYWVLIEEYDSGLQYPPSHLIQRAGVMYTSIGIVPAANAYLVEDGGELLTADLSLGFTITSSEAQRLAKITLEKSRRGLSVSYPCNHKAFPIDIMDVVAVNNSLLGWSEKLFRVTGWSFSMLSGTALSLSEYDAAIYDWVPGDSTPLIPPIMTNLPNPWVVTAPTGLAITESLYAGNTQSVIMTKAIFSFVSTSAQASLYDIYRNGTYLFTSRDTTVEIEDVPTGSQTFGVIASNTLGAKSPLASIVYNILGKTAPPPDVDNFLVTAQQDGTRDFSWTLNDPPLDLAGYRIKFSSDVTVGWFNLLPLHSGLLQTSPFECNQLMAGTYQFGIVAVDTTGNESTNAKYIVATLPDPRLSNVWVSAVSGIGGDDWPGTKTDCYVTAEGILEATDAATWGDMPATWGEATQWNGNPAGTIIYETLALDMGGQIAFTPQVSAYGVGVITTEMATSIDNSTWSAWATPDKSDVQYVKFRFTVVATSPEIASLTLVTAYLVVRPVVEEINDLDTSTLTGSYRIGTGDVRLPLANNYDILKQVSLTLQNVGAGWTWELIDKDLTVGPRVKIYNSSNAAADAVIDAYIKGI